MGSEMEYIKQPVSWAKDLILSIDTCERAIFECTQFHLAFCKISTRGDCLRQCNAGDAMLEMQCWRHFLQNCIAQRRSISSTAKPILLGLQLTYKYWVYFW